MESGLRISTPFSWFIVWPLIILPPIQGNFVQAKLYWQERWIFLSGTIRHRTIYASWQMQWKCGFVKCYGRMRTWRKQLCSLVDEIVREGFVWQNLSNPRKTSRPSKIRYYFMTRSAKLALVVRAPFLGDNFFSFVHGPVTIFVLCTGEYTKYNCSWWIGPSCNHRYDTTSHTYSWVSNWWTAEFLTLKISTELSVDSNASDEYF